MKRITKIGTTATVETKKTRVAAYCRVSTSSDEQLISLDAQKLHYEDYRPYYYKVYQPIFEKYHRLPGNGQKTCRTWSFHFL